LKSSENLHYNLATPSVEIEKIATKNGEYFVNWKIVQNGGGKLRKLSLEYGLVCLFYMIFSNFHVFNVSFLCKMAFVLNNFVFQRTFSLFENFHSHV